MEAVKGVGDEGRHRTHSSVSERIALWASLENGSHVEREEKRYSDDQPRLRIKTAHERESRAEDCAPRTAPATTDLAPFPSASRNRSLSATGRRQSGGDGGQFAGRLRHTQSVSSVHAPIPPPVYPVRSQPIGLLSRSSSLNNGTSTSPRPLRAESFAGTCTSPVKRQALHRSESLPAFPPEHYSESSSTDRRRQGVSQDEFATLPSNPKHWRPSHLSLYLSATLSLPPPVREDITAFIVTSALSGRTFLRLREADLEEIGINVLWRKALVVARDALKWEATGGRTFWGLEGPSLVSVVAESFKEADVPFTVGGLEAGPEQLSILERRIQELEAEDEHVPYKNGPATEPACLATGQGLSPRLAHEEIRRQQDLAKPEAVPVVPSGAVSVISPEEANRSVLRRRPRRPSPTGDGTDELASGSGSTTEDTDGAWDVGRGGWPHDRIEGWRQLNGYVFAASVGIGIIVGEVVASRLLGLRRR
ncbi:hypothetical protein JCM3774_005002 [Rhodotorula dairenensis]